MGISVIIATLGRHNYLVGTTADLLAQEFEDEYEIIVVDQSETEDEVFIRSFGDCDRVRYFHISSFRGLPEARNFGSMQSRYDYLLFLDDDIKIHSHNLLNEHYKSLQKENVAIVAGGVTDINRPNYDVRNPGSFDCFLARAYGGFHQNREGYVMHAIGANFSVRKSIFFLVGGCDEHYNVGSALGEETDLCLRIGRLGYQVYFNPKADVSHLAAPSGGCREEDADSYVYALIHNRTMHICRFCRWYHYPTAYLYSIRLTIHYAMQHHRFFLRPYLAGIKDGISDYRDGVRHRYLI